MNQKPFKIESGIAIPSAQLISDSLRGRLRTVIQKMKCGESFVYTDNNRQVYAAAKEIGAKIKVRKLSGEGYRVWRTA